MDKNTQYTHAKKQLGFYVVCECNRKFEDYQEYNDHKWECTEFNKALAKAKSDSEKYQQKPKVNFTYKNNEKSFCKHCAVAIDSKQMSRHLLLVHQQKSFKKQSQFVPIYPPSKKHHKKEEEQKMQCYLCGVMMTLNEVSSHAERCQANTDICGYCSMRVPKELIDDHIFACEDKRRQEYRMLYDSRILENLIREQDQSNERAELVEESKQQKGLSKSKIKRFQETPFIPKKNNEGDQIQEECVICYGQFQENSKIIRLPCLHIFHPSCIRNWLPLDKRCPTCKMIIKLN